ncbi:MAG: DUF1698 domain-containing protein [Candidatus Obscuribacterales bacterium]|nr:DUF1698 domain-containing protein [Candidatus Obscuribacterales bacterium]
MQNIITPKTEDPRQQDLYWQGHWYYSLELEPGEFTPGFDHGNVFLTRSALKNVPVAGLSCLDIGCMEGLISILLSRRGAARIVAYDRIPQPEKVDYVRQKLRAEFDYRSGFPLSRLADKVSEIFDLVVFSGVYYHMFDPLAGLLRARSFLRNGGIMLIETAAVMSDEVCNYFNSSGRFYAWQNYWFPSLAALDYQLRFCRLKPLDVFYFKQESKAQGLQLCRVCIPCLAVSDVPADLSDTWIADDYSGDFSELIDWTRLQSDRLTVGYQTKNQGLIMRADSGGIDVYQSAINQPQTIASDPLNNVRLTLSAKY